jgi:hypothetical protein
MGKGDNLFCLFDDKHFDGYVGGNQFKAELVEQIWQRLLPSLVGYNPATIPCRSRHLFFHTSHAANDTPALLQIHSGALYDLRARVN